MRAHVFATSPRYCLACKPAIIRVRCPKCGHPHSEYFGPENLGETVRRVEALKRTVPAPMTLPEMALRFILSNPMVATVIPGMRRVDHVRANMAAGDGTSLSDEVIAELRKHRWDREPAPWSD